MKYELIKNSANDINHLMQTVLNNRGITNIEEFMKSNKEDLEQNSYSDLNNIDIGVQTLLKHIKNKDMISLVVDPDVDGICSSAALYNYLQVVTKEENLPEINWNIVTHSGKGHGLSDDIEVDPHTKLIITPDGGSNDFEQHKKLKDADIDVLVIDHHVVDRESENAIIINNQTSENYKNKAFSGVGVVYRFLQAIDDELFTSHANDYLDLVALGNISDVMDTSDYETRYFIQQGILQENLVNPFLKILVKKTGVDVAGDFERYIYPIDVSFKIAPLVNALLRLGTVEEKEKLFTCFISPEEDLSTRKGICKEIINIMQGYKESQDEEKQKLLEDVSNSISEEDLNCPVLIIDVTNLVSNTEIVGLTAMNLASKYKRPVMMGTQNTKKGILGGSLRVNNGFPDINFKDTIIKSGLVPFAQGHQQAAGFSFPLSNKEKLQQYFRDTYGNEVLQNEHIVDFIISNISDIAPSDFFLIQTYKNLWGKGIEEPTFVIENIPFYPMNLDVLGKKSDTVKYTYSKIEFMFFRCSSEEQILKIANGQEYDPKKQYAINVVGKLGISSFAGRTKNQMIVDDYEIIEVENEISDFTF
ncbi:MAG: DHH family phosphoesterase [Clostridia bacterium]